MIVEVTSVLGRWSKLIFKNECYRSLLMSNHPMCKECVAVSVCGVKYGQPSCVKVHGLVMSFGKTVANSGILEAEKTASPNTTKATICPKCNGKQEIFKSKPHFHTVVCDKCNGSGKQ